MIAKDSRLPEIVRRVIIEIYFFFWFFYADTCDKVDWTKLLLDTKYFRT